MSLLCNANALKIPIILGSPLMSNKSTWVSALVSQALTVYVLLRVVAFLLLLSPIFWPVPSPLKPAPACSRGSCFFPLHFLQAGDPDCIFCSCHSFLLKIYESGRRWQCLAGHQDHHCCCCPLAILATSVCSRPSLPVNSWGFPGPCLSPPPPSPGILHISPAPVTLSCKGKSSQFIVQSKAPPSSQPGRS